jgi:hypothetical protein
VADFGSRRHASTLDALIDEGLAIRAHPKRPAPVSLVVNASVSQMVADQSH